MTVHYLDLPVVPLDVTLTKDMLIDRTWPAHSSILWFTVCPGHCVSGTFPKLLQFDSLNVVSLAIINRVPYGLSQQLAPQNPQPDVILGLGNSLGSGEKFTSSVQ